MSNERIISVNQIECRGVKRDSGEEVNIASDDKVSAIVQVFSDGRTMVMCPRLSLAGLCTSSEIGRRGAFCPYKIVTPLIR